MANQRGSIFEKSGGWYLRYRDVVLVSGGTVRKRLCERLCDSNDRYKTERDVRPLADAFLAKINGGLLRPESTMLVSTFAETAWLPWAQENCKPSTVAGYVTFWRTYIRPHLAKTVTLRDFRPCDATNLLAAIHRLHGVSGTTLKHCKGVLSGIFSLARQQGALDTPNPVTGAQIPKRAAVAPKNQATTLDEVLAILNTLEQAGELRATAAVGLCFFSGLRPGEARGSAWEDFDGKQLFVRRSVWHGIATAPKTVAAAAPVPVIEPLAEILEKLRVSDGNPTTGPILRGPTGSVLNLDNLSKRTIAPLLKAAGIEWKGFYSLRRGIATTLAGMTQGGYASMGLLRHTNLGTTLKHYVKADPTNTIAAMSKLEQVCKVVNERSTAQSSPVN